MSGPPRDQNVTHFRVQDNVVAKKLVTRQLTAHSVVTDQFSLIGGEEGDILLNVGSNQTGWSSLLTQASQNNGAQFFNIQRQVQQNNRLNFIIHNLYTQVLSGDPFPSFPTGRTITFNNNTSSTTIDIYMEQGYPEALPATIISGGSGVIPTGSVSWPIPETQNWNGNFLAMPTGVLPPLGGTTLAEFGLNQLWSGFSPSQRDTFDISTVPPGIGTQCNNGPHSACVAISAASGLFTTQETMGYNIGIEIIPPPIGGGSLPRQTVTCTSTDGNSADSVGYPNDTTYPKQQTIDCSGDYTVNFLDPVVS